MDAGAAAVEAVRYIEVDFYHRCDKEQAGAGAALPLRVLQLRAIVHRLCRVGEDGRAELGAAYHRCDRHPQFGRCDERLVTVEGSCIETTERRASTDQQPLVDRQ